MTLLVHPRGRPLAGNANMDRAPIVGIAGPATNGKLAELQAAALDKLSNIAEADEGDGPAPL